MADRSLRISDVTALLARVVVGVTFVLHGLEKAADLEGTAGFFGSAGIPFPEYSALLGTGVEVVGGALLVIGLGLPAVGPVLAAQMVVAIAFVHVGQPFVGGYELPLVLGATALALGFAGGRFSVDRLLPWGRTRATAEAAPARVS
ncbi:DoxX family protein [Nocardiopsis sp. NRRL B-16309]|uniref:DoxX family protein n=1 Tax=Nocardiopsis sp. NRRL B-16309 TaxID=1519494 RepID=UPI0006B03FAB|nr:DoxX family protein [Nocardiopsis sp. NRRL B-16309]KOX14044.1 DoxX family protein [Nocardiopsis sp. NRRL B-16309]